MQQSAQPGRQDEWKEGGLYMTVLAFLPDYRTRRGKLDVRRLGGEIKRSPEAIYRWFRRDDLLDMDNARELVRIANEPENVRLLAEINRLPPKIDELIRFV